MGRALIADEPCVIVLDPTRDWANVGGFEEVADIGALVRAVQAQWRGGFRIAYTTTRQDHAFEHVSNVLMQVQAGYFAGRARRKITLVVEEMADAYGNRHQDRGDLDHARRNLLQGRHYGLNLIGITQRPQDMAARFRDQCSEFYVMPLMPGPAFDYAVKLLGRDRAEELRAMAPGRYLRLANGRVEPGGVF